VVAISASVYDVSEAALRARGFDGFLPKPVAEGPLFTMIARLLDLRLEQVGPAGTPSPKGALGKAALDALNADWRRGFRDKVAMGDLEAAERCLDSLEDPGLRETLRGHLQAYDLQVLLDRLG
jgi:hypothetical protein